MFKYAARFFRHRNLWIDVSAACLHCLLPLVTMLATSGAPKGILSEIDPSHKKLRAISAGLPFLSINVMKRTKR